MLYVDQPIGVGFSYGNDTVYSSASAAPPVWKLLQAFFANFQQYKNREFGLFTESYGGHFGPCMYHLFSPGAKANNTAFAAYFESQNAAIYSGQLKAQPINLVALGINNGWYDVVIQERTWVSFSVNNSYYPLINQSIADSYIHDYDLIKSTLEKCGAIEGDDADCVTARTAYVGIETNYSVYYPDFNGYDIRLPSNATYPPDTYIDYLHDPAIKKAIGANPNVVFAACSDDVHAPFSTNGDSELSLQV